MCWYTARRVAQFAENFKPGQRSFLGPGDEERWYGSLIKKPHGEWNSIAENMIQELAMIRHPVFRCSSQVPRNVLKRKGKGKVSLHYSAEPNSAEMLMKTFVSVIQLSIYRAVLTWYLGRRRECNSHKNL